MHFCSLCVVCCGQLCAPFKLELVSTLGLGWGSLRNEDGDIQISILELDSYINCDRYGGQVNECNSDKCNALQIYSL